MTLFWLVKFPRDLIGRTPLASKTVEVSDLVQHFGIIFPNRKLHSSKRIGNRIQII